MGKRFTVNKGLYNFDTIIYDYYKDSNVLVEALRLVNTTLEEIQC